MRLELLPWLVPLAVLLAPIGPALSQGRHPAALVQEPPRYPQDLVEQNLDGKVLVRFDLTDDGAVTNLRVADSSPGLVFEREALEAVRAWRYLPKAADLPGTQRRDILVSLAFRFRVKDHPESLAVIGIPCDRGPLRLAGAARSECEALPDTLGVAADLPDGSKLRLRASLAEEAMVRDWLRPVVEVARGRVGELGGADLPGLPDTVQAFAFARPGAEGGLTHCVWFARMDTQMPALGVHSGQVGSLCAAKPVDALKLRSVLAQVTPGPTSDFAVALSRALRDGVPPPRKPELSEPFPFTLPAELEALALSLHANMVLEAGPDGRVTAIDPVSIIPALLFDDTLRDLLTNARFKPPGEGQVVLSGFPLVLVQLTEAAPAGWKGRDLSTDCRTATFDLPRKSRLRCTRTGAMHMVSGGDMDGYWELLLDRVSTARAPHADAGALVEAVRATSTGKAAGLGPVGAEDDTAWSRFARDGRVCLWIARVTPVGDGQNRAYGAVCVVGTAEVDVGKAVRTIRRLIPGKG